MPQLRQHPESESAGETRPELPHDQPEDDPYRYGWRVRWVPTPDGGEERRLIPLTFEDLLDPQEGDHVTQDTLHHKLVGLLTGLLERRYRGDDAVAVYSDLKVYFKVPDLPGPAPDVLVVRGIRDRGRRRRSFRESEESGDIILAIEVVSADYAEKDYKHNRLVYERAGIPEYLIVDPLGEYLAGPCKLTGYRLDAAGRYQAMEPDEGRLHSETTGLWFGTDPEGRGLVVVDAATGERLLTAEEEAERAHKEAERARREAERADREAAERRALEAEVEGLRKELRRQRHEES